MRTIKNEYIEWIEYSCSQCTIFTIWFNNHRQSPTPPTQEHWQPSRGVREGATSPEKIPNLILPICDGARSQIGIISIKFFLIISTFGTGWFLISWVIIWNVVQLSIPWTCKKRNLLSKCQKSTLNILWELWESLGPWKKFTWSTRI